MKDRNCTVFGLALFALALTAIQSLGQTTYEPYTFTTLAGNAGYGSADGTGSTARFRFAQGVAVDSAGNVYVADSGNNEIRKMTPTGVVTTLAGLAQFDEYGDPVGGSADGTGSTARFNAPEGVAVDSAGNLYVADTRNNTIRKVTAQGVVTTLAGLAQLDANGNPVGGSDDGSGDEARFNGPSGLAVDTAGNIFVADAGNNTIRKVTPAGVVTTLAGGSGSADGTGSAAEFLSPSGIAVDSAGNVYVADSGNNTIRKVTPTGVVTTLAGRADANEGTWDGTGSTARFNAPEGVAVDSAGNVYVADSNNLTIRKVTPAGVVTTLAGLASPYAPRSSADGTGFAARFNRPSGMATDSAANIYVADSYTIRKVTPAGVVTTLAGVGSYGNADGTGSDARFNEPNGVAVDSADNVYVTDSQNGTIRKVTPAGVVTTLVGLVGSAGAVSVDSAGNLYLVSANSIQKATLVGTNWLVTTLAGQAGSVGSTDGTGKAARFSSPAGLAVDSAGNVYVADTHNSTIRKVTPAGVVTTLAGLAGRFGSADGTGRAARFSVPLGLAVDSAGNVYVADDSTIRKVTPEGVVTRLTSLFGGTPFASPFSLAVDSTGNIYAADRFSNTIGKETPARVVMTLAGLRRPNLYRPSMGGSADGTGSAAQFRSPWGVAVDSAGNVYVADTGNNTIRKGYPAPRILNSGPGFGFNGGHFGFTLTGPMGRLVIVEASTDLASWLPIWTNTFAGALNFSDPQSGVYSNRFYRAHPP